MTDSERWAWWTLGVVVLTAAAFGGFLALTGNVQASHAMFALLALAAAPAASRRYFRSEGFDERDKEISGKALLAAFRGLWMVFIGLVVTLGFVKGWDASLSLPMWLLASAIWWAVILVLAVESVTTLVLYRRGPHV
jgi:magnesium-transporting ATPase (P-type)